VMYFMWSTNRVMYFMWSTTTGVCLLVYHYSGSGVSVWSTARAICYVWCTTRVLYYSWSSTRSSISHMLHFIKSRRPSRRPASGRILGLRCSHLCVAVLSVVHASSPRHQIPCPCIKHISCSFQLVIECPTIHCGTIHSATIHSAQFIVATVHPGDTS